MMLSQLRLRLASMLLVVASADQWKSIQNKECDYSRNEEKLTEGTLDDFKAKAAKEGFEVFVVWQDRAYYRNSSAEHCLNNLQEPPHDNHVTLYYKAKDASLYSVMNAEFKAVEMGRGGAQNASALPGALDNLKSNLKEVVEQNEVMDAEDREQGLVSLRSLAVGLPCMLAGLVAVVAIAKKLGAQPLHTEEEVVSLWSLVQPGKPDEPGLLGGPELSP